MPPPELWSLGGRGSGKGGLVGCVRDLVINGLSVQLGEVARYKEKNTLVYTVLCCSKFHIERGRKHENFKAYRQTDRHIYFPRAPVGTNKNIDFIFSGVKTQGQ